MLHVAAKITSKDLEFARKAAPYFKHNTGYYFDQFTDSHETLIQEIAETAAYLRTELLKEDSSYMSTAGITVTKRDGVHLNHVIEYSIDVTEEYSGA